MKGSITLIVIALLAILILAQPAVGKIDGVPMMSAVMPETVRAGEEVVVTGSYLDKTRVSEVYLTDGKNDFKLQILEQGQESVKLRIPASMKPGRYQFMVLTPGTDGMFIEEPVKLNVE
jgi:hypothetical protein